MDHRIKVEGSVAKDFEGVREAFARNFAEGLDVGASFAVMQRGEMVVDLWCGYCDRAKTRPWTADTLINVYSTTKGPTALAVAMLVDRGLISYDDPVARHWPEFSAAGKGDITVAQIMSHQAGLCGVRDKISIEDFYDWNGMCERLAQMSPWWTPGEGSGYHAITYGYLAGELVRRIDGRTIGQFMRDEMTGPLAADFFVGLPQTEEPRVAHMIAPQTPPQLLPENAADYTVAALANPPLEPEMPNAREWRAAEIPAANGQASARGLARIYGALAQGGTLDGSRVIGAAALHAATAEQVRNVDRNLGMEMRWANGFILNLNGLYGPSEQAFGHSGWGGSMAYADPENALAVAFTMNQMAPNLQGDPRTIALNDAVYASL